MNQLNRWSMFAIMLLVVVLSACNGSGETQEDVNSPNEEEQQVTNTHAYGETVIPADVSRIASINLEDMLVSLEVPLVLATAIGSDYYLEDQLGDTPISVWGEELNYEAILESNPDLIVASNVIDENTYDELTKIAPTILYDREKWRDSIIQMGSELGYEDKANAVIETVDNQLEEAQNKIEKAVGTDNEVIFLRTTATDLRINFPGFEQNGETYAGYAGMLYKDLSLSPAPIVLDLQEQTEPERQVAEVSQEILPELSSDFIFVASGSAGGTSEDVSRDQESFGEIEQSSLWKDLPAVQKDQVFSVNPKHWISSGPIADQLKIDDVVEALTE
ncbi:ABC transporter substrate-binding protein [Alkalicoccobacillus murimartini]|uniref:Iron complex transport system substrate-binding protein n=1 Tax=Alkalicoccobacillus murimartini TaxID=171685 RepID=A0ABT9YG49_9BACI|nr:ABC transporter substrate-binding protein [Alkalicoccobacillus murimartini]MDQ0206839.1 iron complex transport system substrate-binding protein [Alkalicoccobacillus murimartini]